MKKESKYFGVYYVDIVSLGLDDMANITLTERLLLPDTPSQAFRKTIRRELLRDMVEENTYVYSSAIMLPDLIMFSKCIDTSKRRT